MLDTVRVFSIDDAEYASVRRFVTDRAGKMSFLDSFIRSLRSRDCMDRLRAVVGGLVAVIVIFGGFIAIRTLSRFLRAVVWFSETVALFGLAAVIGYVTYRILWGTSDDPRRH